MYTETRGRCFTKAMMWRIIATMNSFLVLLMGYGTDKPLMNAVLMNITGFFIYFFYERGWNKVSWGKITMKVQKNGDANE